MNTAYLTSNRGIIKIIQIIIGFVLVSTTFGGLFTNKDFMGFGDWRMGYIGTLNGVCIIVNIVFLVLNLVELGSYGLEKFYAVLVAVLWLLSAIFIVWLMITRKFYEFNPILSAILIVITFVLHLYDVRILQGEVPN
ncbi:hypothetical protein Ddc_12901 [Ditylenchus destructor]|nr:hypothetical protein Ddc_12901 [Ditylenchus destructor]